MSTVRAIVTDIEGTTSSLSFVHEVLFPYARRALPAFVRARQDAPAVRAVLDAAAEEAGVPRTDTEAIIAALCAWIDADRKVTALKDLQGMIWEAGYRDGAFRGHVHDDAVAALRAWHAAGITLHVYSSGSVQAQRLLFGHAEQGDLTPLFSGYFDTTTGPKREAASYAAIARALALPPETILFLSDVPEELDAARAAGLRTVWVIREEEGRFRLADAASGPHPAVARLTDIVLDG
jgi:enolase-phosphatase E1